MFLFRQTHTSPPQVNTGCTIQNSSPAEWAEFQKETIGGLDSNCIIHTVKDKHLQEVSEVLPASGRVNMAIENTVSSEYVPAGKGCPTWLFDALCQPHDHAPFMVLHPTELHRQHLLERLHAAGVVVSPQYHLTLNRLVRLLHVDLRLPVLLDDEASNFMAIHARCVEAAENAELPFLFTPGVGKWTLAKTRRLQRLHGELLQLRRPFAWEGDPGAEVFHRLCLDVQQAAGGTLPSLVSRHVLDALEASMSPPFHLSEVAGIIVLDAAPDFTEIEQGLLSAVSKFAPIHQLLHPGSFRLGYHGAYLVDEQPCDKDGLPDWVPTHDPWVGEDTGWQTIAGQSHQTEITRVTLDERRHALPAALTMIKAYMSSNEGRLLVIDAGVQERSLAWSTGLASIGVHWRPGSTAMNQQPTHHAILRAATLAQGMGAWSLESLRSTFFSPVVPFQEDLFPELSHPSEASWRPRPDLQVLGDIARTFHVLGGPGAIARWLGVLAGASPSFSERRPVEKAQALEETQWWLACLLHAWSPMLSPEDRHLLRTPFVGCTSGDTLPMPDTPNSGMAWFSWLLSSIDVAKFEHRRAPFDAGFGALQRLVESVNAVKSHLHSIDLPFDDNGAAFIDILEHIGASTDIAHQTSRTDRVNVVTPDDALGCTADVVLLVGLDVDAWSMRSSNVPWLDAQAQLELGLFQTDRLVRRGRHHLRHLLNAGRYVVAFDSSPEEGGGPSAPLAEWLTDVRRSRSWESMRTPPSFLPSALYEGDAEARPFTWVVREEGHGSWLTPVMYSTVEGSDGVRSVRHGFRGRDRRQQLGLDVRALQRGRHPINHPSVLIDAFEGSIQADRRRRQPLAKWMDDHETFGWENRVHLASVDAVTLRPTRAALKVNGMAADSFPHLGHREEKSISVSVDPRPLPPYALDGLGLDHRFGSLGTSIERSVWSPSRLEAWLKCPRQAWLKQTLNADDDEGFTTEDIDVRTRGQVVHDVEAAILQGHGVPIGFEISTDPLPLHLGPMGEGRAGWDAILDFLQNEVHWLGRQNAVSVHRTRDLIDATPEMWEAHQSGELELEPQGRLARLLEADLDLHHAAPVALEWSPRTEKERFVHLDAVPDDDLAGFRLYGMVDRVDVLVLPEHLRSLLEKQGVVGEATFDDPYPLHGEGRTAQRLVIIRDLKTVQGPNAKSAGLRHTRCLFEDLQLALYARAWERLHPNDRVIGVGGSEVGEFTTHYVELDADLAAVSEELEIGELTEFFPLHFPSETRNGVATTAFRRWMAERLAVAQRVVDTAQQGHVNPTPGAHCSFCTIAHSCAVSDYAGGDF